MKREPRRNGLPYVSAWTAGRYEDENEVNNDPMLERRARLRKRELAALDSVGRQLCSIMEQLDISSYHS